MPCGFVGTYRRLGGTWPSVSIFMALPPRRLQVSNHGIKWTAKTGSFAFAVTFTCFPTTVALLGTAVCNEKGRQGTNCMFQYGLRAICNSPNTTHRLPQKRCHYAVTERNLPITSRKRGQIFLTLSVSNLTTR
jgi:hypothetical protein